MVVFTVFWALKVDENNDKMMLEKNAYILSDKYTPVSDAYTFAVLVNDLTVFNLSFKALPSNGIPLTPSV